MIILPMLKLPTMVQVRGTAILTSRCLEQFNILEE
jgi:hypothetical protein